MSPFVSDSCAYLCDFPFSHFRNFESLFDSPDSKIEEVAQHHLDQAWASIYADMLDEVEKIPTSNESIRKSQCVQIDQSNKRKHCEENPDSQQKDERAKKISKIKPQSCVKSHKKHQSSDDVEMQIHPNHTHASEKTLVFPRNKKTNQLALELLRLRDQESKQVQNISQHTVDLVSLSPSAKDPSSLQVDKQALSAVVATLNQSSLVKWRPVPNVLLQESGEVTITQWFFVPIVPN